MHGDQARFFADELHEHLKHKSRGVVAMASASRSTCASHHFPFSLLHFQTSACAHADIEQQRQLVVQHGTARQHLHAASLPAYDAIVANASNGENINKHCMLMPGHESGCVLSM